MSDKSNPSIQSVLNQFADELSKIHSGMSVLMESHLPEIMPKENEKLQKQIIRLIVNRLNGNFMA
jgi:hypothetical protein